jgi:hypothetical protein
VTARARIGAAVALAAALLAGGARAAPRTPAGRVTFVAGHATAGGRMEPLAVGIGVYAGDVLETGRRTRLEVKLADESVLRLGPLSRATVQAASFGATVEDRKVSAKLVAGQIWANVAKAVGGEARFEVRTENAVAGVRGTTFRVDASKDRSVVVRVYSGTVAVAAGAIPRPEHGDGKPARKQVAGPEEVSREQWERIVTSMMAVRVSADGTASEPEAFALAQPGRDEWEEWNRARDAAR